MLGRRRRRARKTTLVNRVNQIYDDDLAIALQLVAGNDSLNFSTVGGVHDRRLHERHLRLGRRLTQNHDAINNVIGNANYDIGHLVTRARNGGGIAGLGVVGTSGSKGARLHRVAPPDRRRASSSTTSRTRWVTSSAARTRSTAEPDNCGGGEPRDAIDAVEPGSGSSIMAYAGICGDDDLQDNSDPYFSQRSIANDPDLRRRRSRSGGTAVTTANRSPVVDAGPDATVPSGRRSCSRAARRTPTATRRSSRGSRTTPAPAPRLFEQPKLSGPLFRHVLVPRAHARP